MRIYLSLFLSSLLIVSNEGFCQLYVSLSNNKVVRYDTSSANPNDIAASAQTFISTNLNDPAGMAVDSGGNFLVANSGGDSISYFNAAGQYQSSISQNVMSPYGIALDSQNNIYVAQLLNGISKMDSSGNLIWQTQPRIIRQMNELPNGIALDSKQNVYVSMFASGNIVKLNSNGQLLADSTNTNLSLGWTTGIAINSNDEIYIGRGATSDGSITKINESFEKLGVLSTTTTPSGLNPLGLALDDVGNLYVSSYNSTISKFDVNGNFLFTWTTEGTPNSLLYSVPEPSALSLLAIGLSGFALVRRRRS